MYKRLARKTLMFVQQIVQKYDIVLLQEIRDSSETVIYEFVDTLNRYSHTELYCMTMCMLY